LRLRTTIRGRSTFLETRAAGMPLLYHESPFYRVYLLWVSSNLSGFLACAAGSSASWKVICFDEYVVGRGGAAWWVSGYVLASWEQRIDVGK
jgi:hypothetical protein